MTAYITATKGLKMQNSLIKASSPLALVTPLIFQRFSLVLTFSKLKLDLKAKRALKRSLWTLIFIAFGIPRFTQCVTRLPFDIKIRSLQKKLK